jgi:hypothetical protein
LTVDVASLDTKNKKRDEHLRSADFFHATAHPKPTFVSTAFETTSEGSIIKGDLQVSGKRVRLELPVAAEPVGEDRVRLQATGQVRREDIGMNWNKFGMIRGDVRLGGAEYEQVDTYPGLCCSPIAKTPKPAAQTTILAYIAAMTERLVLSTSITLTPPTILSASPRVSRRSSTRFRTGGPDARPG